jgi:hypothetical protein
MSNKYLILIYVAFLNIIGLPILAQDSLCTGNANGWISIVSAIDSINIFLDNLFIGQTPIYQKTIPTGKHQLKAVHHPITEWNLQAWNQNFEIAANETLFFQVTPPRQIYLNSQPYGASVIHQDQIIGTTPFFFLASDSTAGFVVLRKPGYLDFIIKPAELNTLFVNAQLKENKEIKDSILQFSSIIQNRQKRKKILTYSMLGLTVASGISAVYFKQQADDRYQDYQSASHPADLNRLFEETQKLDNYTAVSYGVFQLSFITSLYLLLFNK